MILETALLTQHEKINACLLAQAGGADYVKTDARFSSSGASVEDVNLMRRVVGNTMIVKAADGIHPPEKALTLIYADAQKIMEGSDG
ncbi:MAG: hypothetical protein WCG34_03645 [Leptolinea sp.]